MEVEKNMALYALNNFYDYTWKHFLSDYKFKATDVVFWVIIFILSAIAAVYLHGGICGSNSTNCVVPANLDLIASTNPTQLESFNYFSVGILFLILSFVFALLIRNEFIFASSICVIFSAFFYAYELTGLGVWYQASSILLVAGLIGFFLSAFYPFWCKRNGGKTPVKVR